jgi:hypothetical protein
MAACIAVAEIFFWVFLGSGTLQSLCEQMRRPDIHRRPSIEDRNGRSEPLLGDVGAETEAEEPANLGTDADTTDSTDERHGSRDSFSTM